ncbi:MAG: SUMF1/EgtB/PvdO family nonheme iron enzyme [bacterium]
MFKRLSLILLLCLAGTLAGAIAPVITTIAPTCAVVGTVITITGTNLDATTAVTFNGIAAKIITDNTATALKVTVPEGATAGKLVITAAGGTVTNSYDFIVLLGLKTNAKDNAEMVWVPGGTFTMGNAVGMAGKEEDPAHQVTLSGYWIYQNDVTVAQYRAFCTATKYNLPTWPGDKFSWKGKTGWDDPALQQHPIINVSWADARAYADWAGVSLPTEAQWEYAACGSQGRNYPWGGTATKDDRTNGWDETRCAHWENSGKVGKSTWPVGSFPAGASWCGAQDMAGNVQQWCGDWYGAYIDAVADPIGPATGNFRVLRGGSWSNHSSYIHSVTRNYNCPDFYNFGVGFRCVETGMAPKNTINAPTVISIIPSSGIVGTVITITGNNLDAVTAVTFNGIAVKTITDNTATMLKVTVPEGATSGKLTVTTTGGTAMSVDDFIVMFGLKTNAKDNAEMLWVPGGTFTMGSVAGVGRDDEHPAHQVTLSGYWIYKNDVTVEQYRAFCAATTRALPMYPDGEYSWAEKRGGWADPKLNQHPIVNVSWYDAKAYADWAGVTLPSEAQWEYAARGPQGNNYPWGGTATAGDQNSGWDATKCANYTNTHYFSSSTKPVGSYASSASWCGAEDMAGNVYQWCGDWYSAYAAAAVTDPIGPATGSNRVLRGGSWVNYNYYYYGNYRSAHRFHYSHPDVYKYDIGFRCVSFLPTP